MHLSVGERLTGCTWIRTEAKRVHLGGRQGADRVLRPWLGERAQGGDFDDLYPDVCVEGLEKDPF